MLQEVNPYLPAEIINEGNIEFGSSMWWYWRWSPNICMDHFQQHFLRLSRSICEAYSFLFAHNTTLAKIIFTDFRLSNSPFAANIFIPLALMCPGLLCHRHESEAPSATTAMLIHPAVVYKFQDFVPRATTIAPFTIFHEHFPNYAAYPVLSNWQIEIRFFLSPGIYLTSSNVNWFPEVVFMKTSPFPSISKALLSTRYTFPKFPDLKFWNNSLLGDEWKDAPESKIHDSNGLFTLRIRASTMSSNEFTESLSSPYF